MMDKISIIDRQDEPSVRNPNFRGQQQQKFRNRQKEQWNQDPQGQVRAPFQQNYTEGQEEDEEEIVEANHFFQEYELPTFLIEEDQFSEDSLILSDQQFVFASKDLWVVQTEE